MSNAQLEIDANGRVRVCGELSMATVPGLLNQSPWGDATGSEILVDLQGVERADSAGVALLIEWRRAAGSKQQTLRFQNIPAQMLAIARLSGVDGLLDLN